MKATTITGEELQIQIAICDDLEGAFQHIRRGITRCHATEDKNSPAHYQWVMEMRVRLEQIMDMIAPDPEYRG